MNNFEFYCPTKVVFGKDTHETVASNIKKFGGSRVLLHYGSQSAVKSGLIDKIKSYLKADNIDFMELGGVLPNPRLSMVYEGIKLCKSHKLDFVLAVGGGSVIDSAKAIALGATADCDVWDFFLRKSDPTTALPVGCILTIAAAGSETSLSAVIKNDDENTKRGILTDLNRPKFAIMNPELTYSVPKYHIACGVVDILMHTLDRYFTNAKDTDFTDRISEALMQSVLVKGRLTVEQPTNYEARANIMWAGSVTHNTLTGLGKPLDFSVHALERGVSGKYDTAHGAGLAVLWGHWARYVYQDNVEQFTQYANRVFGVDTALEGIEKTVDFFKSIDMPTTFKELGVEDADIDEIAASATMAGKVKVGTFKPLDIEEVKIILKNARG